MKTIILSLAVLLFTTSCEIMPRNSLKDCRTQCKDSKKSKACYEFCDCIHKRGEPLDSCLDKYDKAPADAVQKK
ncbi:MAG: hypothetical protein JWP69_979 [Flaviaesturariibacter sp.]|nr:hypothetical protein [Flaviaesturariibacter sp.]